jgi:hypothetical protein
MYAFYSKPQRLTVAPDPGPRDERPSAPPEARGSGCAGAEELTSLVVGLLFPAAAEPKKDGADNLVLPADEPTVEKEGKVSSKGTVETGANWDIEGHWYVFISPTKGGQGVRRGGTVVDGNYNWDTRPCPPASIPWWYSAACAASPSTRRP